MLKRRVYITLKDVVRFMCTFYSFSYISLLYPRSCDHLFTYIMLYFHI